ncbi:MAG: carbohydrate ABC transporter substrate-binding protein [Ruminococcus sp.]|nr:carbohydrate ABC transporter substrate-binding protein [Ruminococcus sp.]
MTRLNAAALAVLIGVSASGCAQEDTYFEHKEAKSVSFSWWGKDQRNEYTIEAIRDFEKKTGLAVEVHFSEYEGFKNVMDMDFYSDTEADVMQLNYDWLYEYSPNGDGFYDLRELADTVDISVFPEEDLESGTINGKLNALPTSFNAITFYYNEDIYKKYGLSVPSTWEDLFAAAEVMRPDGIYPTELSSKSGWLSAVAYFEQTTGRELYKNGTELDMSEEDYKLMLGFYTELLDKEVTPTADDFDRNDLERDLSAGFAVWISDAEYYCDPSLNLGLHIIIGDYPCVSGAELFGWYKKPTSLYAIKKSTEDPESAARLLDFLVNSEEMNTLQKLGKGIPSSKSALEILEANDMLTGIQFDANQKMKDTDQLGMMSPYVEDTNAVNLFADIAARIHNGTMTLDEAVDETYSDMFRMLNA